jgi:hypothetical protein
MLEQPGQAAAAEIAVPPTLAGRIEAAFGGAGAWRELANAIETVCPDPGSHASDLCEDGDPVELAFVWPGDEVRVTCDPAPGASAATRLTAALSHCGEGLTARQAAIAERLAARLGPNARYGAWVGLRVRHATIVHKLYLEIPDGVAAELCVPAAQPLRHLPVRAMRPVMAGFDPATGGSEIYYRIAPLNPHALVILLRSLGLPPLGRSMVSVIEQLSGRIAGAALPSPDQGLSIAFGPNGVALGCSWYTFASLLLGPPDRARNAVLEHCERHGWNAARYRAVTGRDATGQLPIHGVLGVTATAAGDVAVTVTCSCGVGGRS